MELGIALAIFGVKNFKFILSVTLRAAFALTGFFGEVRTFSTFFISLSFGADRITFTLTVVVILRARLTYFCTLWPCNAVAFFGIPNSVFITLTFIGTFTKALSIIPTLYSFEITFCAF